MNTHARKFNKRIRIHDKYFNIITHYQKQIDRKVTDNIVFFLNNESGKYMLALLHNFTSVYTNIPSCTSFPLQEGTFVCSRVFVQ